MSMSDSPERLDRALEALLADQSPRPKAGALSPEELEMLRVAQLLRGSRHEGPSEEFVEQLHGKIFPGQRRVSRRTAFLSGLGALAAGIVGGVGIDRLAEGGRSSNQPYALVDPKRGQWMSVATTADVQEGAVHPFTAGSVRGFLVNRGGHIYAVSGICTHMGCGLNFNARERTFLCPCHGAEFDLDGKSLYGPGGYKTPLPELPWPNVRINGKSIEVFGA
jgi:nitrite reductase/ring-hydroxylating ferredoxin subunit